MPGHTWDERLLISATDGDGICAATSAGIGRHRSTASAITATGWPRQRSRRGTGGPFRRSRCDRHANLVLDERPARTRWPDPALEQPRRRCRHPVDFEGARAATTDPLGAPQSTSPPLMPSHRLQVETVYPKQFADRPRRPRDTISAACASTKVPPGRVECVPAGNCLHRWQQHLPRR